MPVSPRLALILVTTICAVSAAPSFARPIDKSIKTSVDAAKSATLINAEVKDLADKLASDDPAVRTAARMALVDLATVPGPEQASVQYLNTLATSVNTQLLPLATNKNVLVRLNAAIAIARIANKTDSDLLSPVVLVLLADKNEAIQIWALRAARDVAPAVLRNPLLAPKDKLMPTIVAVAQANPTPAVMDEAYKALMLNHTAKRPPPAIWKPMVATAVTQMGNLLKSRLDAYRNGVPTEPVLDAQAANFLVHPAVFKEISPAQASQSSQLICDLMALAALRSTTAQGADREALIKVVKDGASCVQAIAEIQGKGADVRAVIDPIRQANQQTPNLPALVAKVAPVLQGVGVPVTPTTLPTTAPGK